MLSHARHLRGLPVDGTDDLAGRLADLHFDDQLWAICYLEVAGPGHTFGARAKRVLVSPLYARLRGQIRPRLQLALTRYAIQHSVPVGHGGSRTSIQPAHLKSIAQVQDYRVLTAEESRPGGHLRDFVIDTESWNLRYAVIELRGGGWRNSRRRRLVDVRRISRFPEEAPATLALALTRGELAGAPEYDESLGISEEYENRLRRYYGLPEEHFGVTWPKSA